MAAVRARALATPGDAPLLLALETATRDAGVALLRGESVLAERRCDPDRGTAETLLPAIDHVLCAAGAAVADVDAFAVSIGPGSFTALRVGLATAKGLAFGGDAPLVPVSTLAALALSVAPGAGPAVPLLDARRGEWYAGAFDLSGELPVARLDEGVYTPAELAARLPRRCVLVGEGVAVCGDEIAGVLGEGVTRSGGRPSARLVGALAARLLARGEAVPAEAAAPRYLRRAEAEVKRTGERFEPLGR